jgi:hypothetical protein
MTEKLHTLQRMIDEHHRQQTNLLNQILAEQPARHSVSLPRPKKSELVDRIILESRGVPIDTDYVVSEFTKLYGRANHHIGRMASQTFNRLRQRTPSEIEVVEDGKGSRSGTYRYVGKSAPQLR